MGPQEVLNIARRWVGTKESPNGSNHVPGITDWYGLDRQPWCAMFVSRVFFDAGLPLPASTPKGFAFCPFGVNWFKSRGRWSKTPQVGAVVFFQWPGSRMADHVGIVETVNSNGSITTIEGNTNNGGSSEGGAVLRLNRRTCILGYGMPAYNGAQPQPQPTDNSLEVVMSAFPTLRRGDKGQHVRILQGLLVANGRNIAIDGDFGPGTDSALRNWQRACGLVADGIFGPISFRRIHCV